MSVPSTIEMEAELQDIRKLVEERLAKLGRPALFAISVDLEDRFAVEAGHTPGADYMSDEWGLLRKAMMAYVDQIGPTVLGREPLPFEEEQPQ